MATHDPATYRYPTWFIATLFIVLTVAYCVYVRSFPSSRPWLTKAAQVRPRHGPEELVQGFAEWDLRSAQHVPSDPRNADEEPQNAADEARQAPPQRMLGRRSQAECVPSSPWTVWTMAERACAQTTRRIGSRGCAGLCRRGSGARSLTSTRCSTSRCSFIGTCATTQGAFSRCSVLGGS